MQFSTPVRNGMADSIETTIGTAPTLELRSGAPPAALTDPDSGTLIASMVLPSDWMGPAAGGVKGMSGTWQDLSADADGIVGHFRMKQGATSHIQGTVSMTGGGGDMIIQNNNVVTGQAITVNSFNLTMGNA